MGVGARALRGAAQTLGYRSERTRVTAAVLLALAAGAGTTRAQRGRSVLAAGVAADSAGVPLSNADVLIVDLHLAAHTNWLGEAVIAGVPRGVHTVRVRAFGYAPIELPVVFDHDTVPAIVFLRRPSTALDTVRVTASAVPTRLQDFEQRRAMGLGRFLTEAQLDSAGTEDFQTLMTRRFPGLVLVRNDNSMALASTRAVGKPCLLPILLDGMKLYFPRNGLSNTDIDVEDYSILNTWDLAGVEYYSSAQVPARYRMSDTGCGLLLAWSKQ